MAHEIKAPLTRNTLDDLALALINLSHYSDSTVEYPSFKELKKDDGVMAEWFYPITNGSNEFSELSAINMYTRQEATFEDVGELMLGIGLVEMKHYGKLNDFIRDLGGKIDQVYDSKHVHVGTTISDALQIAIDGEIKTIDFYEGIVNRLSDVKETKTVKITLQFLAKLIADEKVHLSLLQEKLSEYGTEE